MQGRICLFAALLGSAAPGVSQAQDVPSVAPVQSAAPAAPAPTRTLVAGTPIVVILDEDLSSKTNAVGDRFRIVVAGDVLLDGMVVIPKGAIGYGEVTFRGGKGAFGRAGILGIALRSLDLNGKTVELDGRYREEGKDNGAAAGAVVFTAGIFGAAVQGKTSIIPKGRELRGRIGEDFVFTPDMPMSAPAPATDAPQADAQPAAETQAAAPERPTTTN